MELKKLSEFTKTNNLNFSFNKSFKTLFFKPKTKKLPLAHDTNCT